MSDEAMMQELEPEDQLKVQLQEALVSHVANQEQSMAMARTEATNIEIGGRTPDSYVPPARTAYNNDTPSTSSLDYGAAIAKKKIDEMNAMPQDTPRNKVSVDPKGQSTSYIVPFGGEILHASKNVEIHDIDGVRTVKVAPTRVLPENLVKQDREVNVAKVVSDKSQGINAFDTEGELTKMRGMTDLGQKEALANSIYMNLGSLVTVEQKRIKDIAAQRSGLNDAQAALDKTIALEQAAKAMGRVKPGDSTIQVVNARQAFQAALTASNALEIDLAQTSPTLQKYMDQREMMKREMGQINVQQNRQDAQIDKLPFLLTDDRLTNGKLALGIAETNSKALEAKVGSAALRDKALVRVLDADKHDMPRLLADNDPKVRRYAYNIMAGSEITNLKLAPGSEPPEYVKRLEKAILDPESILSPAQLKVINAKTDKTKPENAALTPAERSDRRQRLVGQAIVEQMEGTTRARMERMDMWTFTDPALKDIVEDLRLRSKDGKVLMQDGIDAYVRADLKKPDGTKYTMDEKIAILTANLTVTAGNQPHSIILPPASDVKDVMSANIRNQAMRSYIRQQNIVKDFGLTPEFSYRGRSDPRSEGRGVDTGEAVDRSDPDSVPSKLGNAFRDLNRMGTDTPGVRTGGGSGKGGGSGGGGGGGGGGEDPDGHYVNDNLGSKMDWLTGTKPTAPPKNPEEARQWIDQMERARGNRDRRNKDYSSSKNPLRKVSDEEYNQLANRGRTAERWLLNNGFNLNAND